MSVSQSHKFDPAYGLSKPQVNNLILSGKLGQIMESDGKNVSRSTSRTVYSHESDKKHRSINRANQRGIYVSDNKDKHH